MALTRPIVAFLQPLPPGALYRGCNADALGFETTAELADLAEVMGQARAMEALRFGTGIRREGYNLYVLGPPGMGKHAAVQRLLQGRAAAESAPSDWCYVNNFKHPHQPRALRLPPGRATTLRRNMEGLVEELRAAIPAAFESEEYRARVEEIEEEFKERHEQAFRELQQHAEQHEIAFLRTPAGFGFAPMRKGEVLSPEEYKQLPKSEQERIGAVIPALEEQLHRILRQIPQWKKESRQKMQQLNREVAMLAVDHVLDEFRACYADLPQVADYLTQVQQDVLERVDDFRRQEEPPPGTPPELPVSPVHPFRRYQVNVIVGNGEEQGAPVLYEDNPTFQNLVGRVEHVAQFGALVTDFGLIKPGALHRANGGYLVLDAHKVLIQPFAWEGLKRTVSLEPEPIPLDVKVILVGERLLYYLLHRLDPEFPELFKVAADFEDEVERNAENDLLYARLITTITRQEGLRSFDRGAVARVIEHGARLAGDAERLSTHLRGIADLLREADYWSGAAGHEVVTREDVQKAIDAQVHRVDRLRTRMHEAIERGTVLIDTGGERVAQVNGLSVIDLGNFAFAQPSRITATAGLGEGEVIDIEREVELGGPVHSKGMLILSAFLRSRYSSDLPFSLSASLVFEQSYGEVEGDSASVAELCALLSALAQVPIKQSLAVTGSVNQHGQVQTIGGVNEKIEGFFDVCKRRALTGSQGVLIPSSNVKHLMLRQDVVEAAAEGQFHVYAIDNVDQAMELLTGIPAGERDEAGRFPEGSLNQCIEARLHELSETRRAYAERPAQDSSD
jgi:predicted ATP-dependent protease